MARSTPSAPISRVVLSPVSRLRRLVRRVAGRWSALLGIVIERAVVPPLLSLRSDPVAAADVRSRHGGRAGAAHDLRRAAAVRISIPPGCAARSSIGDFIYSCYRVVLLGVAVACVPATLAAAATAPRSAAWCAPACRTPTWSARSASRSQPYMTAVAALGIGLAGLAGVLLAPIYSRASGDGRGDHHAGLRRGGDRRARLVLGRGRRRRCWSASSRASWSASAIPRPRPPRSIC